MTEKATLSSRLLYAAAGLLFALAVALRLPGLFPDFWLDEIWALGWAHSVSSPVEIFTRIHFDTNHWLYSLFLFFCGPGFSEAVYRFPAFAAGILIPGVLWLIHREKGSLESLTALLLSGASCFLIVYATEARGYSLVILFTLLDFRALDDFMARGRLRSALLFNLCSILGFLSHLTFTFAYAAFAAWSALRFLARDTGLKLAARNLLLCHLVPCLFFVALYLVDIRHMAHGGADTASWILVWRDFLAIAIGVHEAHPVLATLAAVVCAALILAEMTRGIRDGSAQWLLFLVAVWLAPAAAILANSARFPFWVTRHFIVCYPFVLLLLVRLLGRAFRSGRGGKIAYGLFLAFYLAANAVSVAPFLKNARGRYLDAIRYMAGHTTASEVTVGSDHDFRTQMALGYYVRRIPPEKQFYYCPSGQWTASRPEWVILHAPGLAFSPDPSIQGANGCRYTLTSIYPYGGFSGWNWALYRKTDVQPEGQGP